MWLINSSVGRKFIMALTGACLVLFVTFHCLMNSVAILWPAAYNTICEILGANWYALVASAGLGLLFVIHIIYAVMLTIQNRQARGNVRYEINRRPQGVEWSSKNMFVLGVVILAFLIVHLIQFWAKMQLAEIRGVEGAIPPAAGTLFISEAFSCIWTPIVYIIGFIALWFHMNHGFWSMFQSIGWDSTVWIPRLKKISCWWTSIVIALFIIQACVFTVKARSGFYLSDSELREQYKEMLAPMMEKEYGKEIVLFLEMTPYEQASMRLRSEYQSLKSQLESPMAKDQLKQDPQLAEQIEKRLKALECADAMFSYIEKNDPKKAEVNPMMMTQPVM